MRAAAALHAGVRRPATTPAVASRAYHGYISARPCRYAPIDAVCRASHQLLKLLVSANRRCADVLQTVGAVDLLLRQMASGWSPPVIEVFDALMRRGKGVAEGRHLNKSDVKALVDQIHAAAISANLGEFRPDDARGPAQLLGFLSSVCETDGRAHDPRMIRARSADDPHSEDPRTVRGKFLRGRKIFGQTENFLTDGLGRSDQ